jgi:hypothetical protein
MYSKEKSNLNFPSNHLVCDSYGILALTAASGSSFHFMALDRPKWIAWTGEKLMNEREKELAADGADVEDLRK